MRVVSADWVVPVEGEPLPDGAVAIADDGTIAAVGPASELGRGERFEGCVIVPGFVNCHSHLEYAVYAGFGDGLSFGPWISTHIERKARLTRPFSSVQACLPCLS
jgi:5-methylthioadenosine/S-adenosylhomocysteine deaminase